jgi:hypothetical protein
MEQRTIDWDAGRTKRSITGSKKDKGLLRALLMETKDDTDSTMAENICAETMDWSGQCRQCNCLEKRSAPQSLKIAVSTQFAN